MSAADHMDSMARSRTLASLAESLAIESRLLGQLADVLREQREGVARDDVEVVDDSVHAAHRVMQTLSEARRRRNTLVHLLTDRRDVQVTSLDLALGAHMTEELEARQAELQTAARSLSWEADLNRDVLTRAIQSGDDYVRKLVAPATAPAYTDRGAWSPAERAPTLINQRV